MFNLRKLNFDKIYDLFAYFILLNFEIFVSFFLIFYFQVICNCSVDQLRELSIPEKKNLNRNQASHLSVLLQTHSSCGLVGVRDNNIYLFRSVNVNETGVQISPAYIVLLLEYAATAGWDWWDILLAAKQSKFFVCVKYIYFHKFVG